MSTIFALSGRVRTRACAGRSPLIFQVCDFMKAHQSYRGHKLFSTFQNLNQMKKVALDSGRVYVLGVGNLGRLFSHALANSENPPPISLLFHRSSLLQEWEQGGRTISITANGIVNSNGSFDVEFLDSSHEGIIENLVVTTKAVNTAFAMSSIAHRLNPESTVLFTQNGMGIIDEVNEQVFKDVCKRPNYLTSISSHGVFTQGPFRSVHAGFASVSIGRSLQDPPPVNPSKAQYLVNKIVGAPALAAKEYPSQELLYLQLEKLVINAMINPLTAIFNCKNGELFIQGSGVKLMRLLLQEASQVLQLLPEIRSLEDPDIVQRFSARELELKVLDVAEKTALNTSSMLQDVRAGRETEIDYINGWIVKSGKELGPECEHNAQLVEMVKEGKKIGFNEVREYFADC